MERFNLFVLHNGLQVATQNSKIADHVVTWYVVIYEILVLGRFGT